MGEAGRLRGLYRPELREFPLSYDAVREAASPDDTLAAFLQTTTKPRPAGEMGPRCARTREPFPGITGRDGLEC